MEDLKLKLSDPAAQAAAEEVLAPFHLSEDTARRITKVGQQEDRKVGRYCHCSPHPSFSLSLPKQVFESEMSSGLRDGLSSSSLLMENTFVPELTDGTEEGHFLALDLGGTNFRVMLLVLHEGKIAKEEVKAFIH